ncbi:MULTISPECIES: flagellar basal body-associated FliL family protein [Vibrio]|jgi:flagellar FliL protein|uniref:Flagellar protein FliL n=4 Tax=Vibrionaceae TaxID=641 RepID=A0A0H0YD14_VIBAL|nr:MULTISPECIES: flagellar basal body-associated FliL family protein [Vibrio]EEZ82521.1 Flagellar protein LafF [Vibrio alginolyticus 40B]MDF5485020.1 flagellar basal body-associated FliL family protein [Vibrio parahaemolyticus]MDW1808285.1 flagellar basal body-associated FliL family protein [Vibrio sp. Vb2362]MDW1970653.1 flagellar basal body-associated FliL family protein [Vibrio sp. 945]MDW2256292.1 flagellar basal body-associated FliL family protein [Vibrio sp. 1409]NAW54900.1 flagellar pr
MTKQQMIALFIAMIITSALVSAVTIMGGIWYLNKHAQESPDSGSLIEDSPLSFLVTEQPTSKGPSFHPLDKVVLTVKGKKQTHFVMLELAIETRRPERIKEIDEYMPMVQNSLLKLFSDKTFDQLQQAGAIDILQDEVKQTLLLAFAKTDIVREIDDVLLTKYVVQ